MKGDFTRSTFRPQKHYSSVRMQQGRLQVDADWNEQADITAYLREQQSRDFLGQNVAAAPRTERVNAQADPFENFRVSLSTNGEDFDTAAESESFYIAAGRIYVNGIWCELQNATSYFSQPDYPEAPKPNQGGQYLAYLDVWQRHITTVDDDFIRESALNSVPDTTTRLQTVCQVKLKPLAKNKPTLEDAIAALTPPPKGTLKARLKPASGLSNGGPSVDNTLYRVEIHKPGPLGTATFKWSKDNGTIVSRIVSIKDNTLTVESPEGFSPGSWVEVTDTYQELRGEPGLLLQLTEKTTGTRLVFDPSKTSDGDKNLIDAARFTSRKPNNILKVRRWDTNAIQTKSDATWIDLGNNGVQINLPQANSAQTEPSQTYATGDYWLIPVRSISPRLDYWPTDNHNEPAAISPQGIQHNTAPLALFTYTNSKFKLAETNRADSLPLGDFRLTFPALTRALDSFGGVIEGSLEIKENLLVKGVMTLAEGVAVNRFSNNELSGNDKSVPTESAVKNYIDTEVREVDEKVSRASKRIDDVENEVDRVETETISRFKTVDSSITRNRASIDSNNTLIVAANTLISSNQSDIATNRNRIDTNGSSIDTNRSSINTNRNDIIANGNSITANRDIIAANENSIDTNRSNITTNKSDITTNENSVNTNRNNINTNENSITTNRSDIATNKSGITTNRNTITANGSDIATNKRDIADINDEEKGLPFLNRERIEVWNRITAVEDDIYNPEGKLSKLSTQVDGVEGQQRQLENSLSDTERALSGAISSKADRNGSLLQDFEAQDLKVARELTATQINGRSITQPSSQTLKENISGLSSQEATILLGQLDPVKFSYRSDEAHRIRAGFIAETVPDIVASADRQAVSILDVTAILAKMTKDHHLAIAQMTSLIEQQQQEISALNAKVERLSNGTII